MVNCISLKRSKITKGDKKMKIKTYIEICDCSTIKDLDNLGVTTKFLQVGYEQFFKSVLEERIDSALVDYTISVEVEE
jgi:hypothetical protein